MLFNLLKYKPNPNPSLKGREFFCAFARCYVTCGCATLFHALWACFKVSYLTSFTKLAEAKLVSGYSLLESFFVRLTVCLSFPIKKFNSNVDSVSVVVKSGITISDITSPKRFKRSDC